jgi:hypothetical protein
LRLNNGVCLGFGHTPSVAPCWPPPTPGHHSTIEYSCQRQNAAQPILRPPSPGTILNMDRSHQCHHPGLEMDIASDGPCQPGTSKVTSVVNFECLSSQTQRTHFSLIRFTSLRVWKEMLSFRPNLTIPNALSEKPWNGLQSVSWPRSFERHLPSHRASSLAFANNYTTDLHSFGNGGMFL